MVRCEDCGWEGHPSELVCSEEDGDSNKPLNMIAFNLCPDCESDNIVDAD